MTDQELIACFDKIELPETLRIDRATTQYEVKDAVQRNGDMLIKNPLDSRARRRLMSIKNALDTPYDGPEKPRLS